MTTRYLFDTNIVSELARPKPDCGVVTFTSSVPDILVSAILFHELTFGLEIAPDSQRPRLDLFVRAIRERFGERAIPVDVPVAETAARLRAAEKRNGRILTVADSIIAGTAMLHDATLVTRNVKDFDGLGIALLDPFANG
jgi:predicted nucleic acid-binding protein